MHILFTEKQKTNRKTTKFECTSELDPGFVNSVVYIFDLHKECEYVLISVGPFGSPACRPAWHKNLMLWFLRYYICVINVQLYFEGTTLWALPAHTTFTDTDHISRSMHGQQQQQNLYPIKLNLCKLKKLCSYPVKLNLCRVVK